MTSNDDCRLGLFEIEPILLDFARVGLWHQRCFDFVQRKAGRDIGQFFEQQIHDDRTDSETALAIEMGMISAIDLHWFKGTERGRTKLFALLDAALVKVDQRNRFFLGN